MGAHGLMHVGSHVVRLDPRLREMSAGIYEGLPRGTTYKKAVKIKADEASLTVEAFTAGGNAQVHEDPAQFRARAASFLDWVKEKYVQELSEREMGATQVAGLDTAEEEEEPLRMLVVSHGGLIHALLGLVVETDRKPMVNNCSVTRLALTVPAKSTFGGRGSSRWNCNVRLVEANATAHLGEHMSESTW
jgi:broad specificity phosphatase PhoE